MWRYGGPTSLGFAGRILTCFASTRSTAAGEWPITLPTPLCFVSRFSGDFCTGTAHDRTNNPQLWRLDWWQREYVSRFANFTKISPWKDIEQYMNFVSYGKLPFTMSRRACIPVICLVLICLHDRSPEAGMAVITPLQWATAFLSTWIGASSRRPTT